MRIVDFRRDAEGARKAVNAWTSDRTRGLIPEIVPPGLLDALTRLVLVNALYLKAPWEQPFDRSETRDQPFTRLDGSMLRVPTMRSDGPRGYAEGPGWQAVDLSYAGSELAMAVLLPGPGRLAEVERRFDGAALTRLLTGFRPAEVRLSLPRWKVATFVPLNDLLAALGMPTAFTDRADFSGMTRQAALFISAVLHQAVVTVDEDGTEAAAATAVITRITAMRRQIELVVDRPYLFVIHDVRTATPLFVGRVTDPAS